MNDTDLELERLLRTHFRDARAEDPTPSALRTAVLAIPQTVREADTRGSGKRRGVLLLAATVALGAGAFGWATLGGGLPPEPNPSLPAYLADPSPKVTPAETKNPQESPEGPTATEAPPVIVPNTGEGIAVGWLPAGTMSTPRALATATVLEDGRVLVTGGFSGTGRRSLASAEIWDPATRTFTPTGSMGRQRVGHAATLLNDGRVLIVGGEPGVETPNELGAEVWDPATGRFQVVGTIPALPPGVTATTLLDGRVLIVGSDVCLGPQTTGRGIPRCDGKSASTWLWNPDGSYVIGPPLHEHRNWQTATRLPDGRVLIVGNISWGIDTPESAEAYDPVTNAFSRVGEPKDYTISGHTATLLGDGRVLITGGDTDDPTADRLAVGVLRTAEVWDPASGTFVRAGRMDIRRRAHQAALLPDGRVIVVGGSRPRTGDFHDPGTATTEIWDPETGTFSRGPQMASPRERPTLVTLHDGSLFVIGGNGDYDARNDVGETLDTAEILDFTPSN